MRTVPSSGAQAGTIPGPLRITLIYLAVGVAWILLSDLLVAALPLARGTEARVQTFKGWGFIAVTALAIYWLVRTHAARAAAAAAALEQTEAPYRLMIEETTEYAIIMIDPHGRVQTWNAGAQRLYGYTTEEALGMPLHRLYDPQGAESVVARELEDAARTGRRVTEGWRRRRDGSRFWANAVTTALYGDDGQLRGFARLSRDMTERRTAEERLRESELRYRRLVEKAPVGILVVNDRGFVAFANREAAQILGVAEPEDLLGTPIADHIDPDYLEAATARLAALASGDVSIPTASETWRRPDGRRVDVDVAAVSTEIGGRRALQLVFRDETARRRAEADLLEAKNLLEQRVRERTAELERANAELQAFTYSVSHDLRAPIRHIDGFARLLEEKEGPALSDEGRRFVATIRGSAQRMGALIDDLLRLSRLGRDTVRPAEVDAEAMVRQVWDELAGRGQTRAVLELKPLPPVHADPALLRQVWQNLLDNAIKYSATRDQPRVAVDAVRENGRTWFRVTDNGVGFDPRYAGKMFAVFQRLHRHDEFPGTGVGLAIVKKVIDLHGGEVRASGEPGRGAAFEFTVGEGR